MTSKLVIVTIPPEVVRMRASSTVLVKASRRVKRDFAGMVERWEEVGEVLGGREEGKPR
jgi:hypothetical protein